MAKNRYVSQLIIKRFSDGNNQINIFNVKDKKILEKKKSVNIFCQYNLYSDEIEDKLNRLLEDPFAKLIDNKVIGKDTIVINRKDLHLIKKFLLLDSIRTLTVDVFDNIFKNFTAVAERYWIINEKLHEIMPNHLPKLIDLNETPQESFERALKVYIESENLLDIIMHKDSTRELYVWSKVFMDGYIAFWDSSTEQDFILTDNGLTSEYEPSHQIYEGLDHSKLSYLLHMIKKSRKDEEMQIYHTLLDRIMIMYENFSIFNLTSTRSVVVINPFFKLFSKLGFMLMNGFKANLKVPDIWPSFIIDRLAFEIPTNTYKIHGSYSLNDEFVYKPHKLTLDDTIYINHLFLSQSNNVIGFKAFDKIKDSLYAFQAIRLLNHKDIYMGDGLSDLSKLISHMRSDEFNYIWEYYKDKEDIRPKINPFDLSDRIARMCMDDTRNNIYALEYLMASEDKVRSMTNFDFMGNPDKRIEIIKNDIQRLKRMTK